MSSIEKFLSLEMLHEKRHRSLHQESLYVPFQVQAINDNHESKLDIMLLFGKKEKNKRNSYILCEYSLMRKKMEANNLLISPGR